MKVCRLRWAFHSLPGHPDPEYANLTNLMSIRSLKYLYDADAPSVTTLIRASSRLGQLRMTIEQTDQQQMRGRHKNRTIPDLALVL